MGFFVLSPLGFSDTSMLVILRLSCYILCFIAQTFSLYLLLAHSHHSLVFVLTVIPQIRFLSSQSAVPPQWCDQPLSAAMQERYKGYKATFCSSIKLSAAYTSDPISIVHTETHNAAMRLDCWYNTVMAKNTVIDIDRPNGPKQVCRTDKNIWRYKVAINGNTGYITYSCDVQHGPGCLV